MKGGNKLYELIKHISKKAGISEEQAKQAVEQVVAFLKQKLPAPIADQIDGVLGGKGPDLSVLGGLFGQK